ncbi:citrate lyase acyl carrier protein [Acidaminococcus fermentans]|uniref:citrate lyase acyl carrier protein n=1 Tax=Acidaminococcus fermentans TaxID=905 RepID=UPI00242E8E35|nr:citrate lyase acyl carrier protein [Acidaminococcus fermentans]
MVIHKKALAGTLESSDCLVRIEPAEGISVAIHSVVEQQFGEQIRKVVCKVLESLDVTGVAVDIQDYGALDCVIAARVETAVRRAGKEA